MASPIGHALAGLAIAWAADLVSKSSREMSAGGRNSDVEPRDRDVEPRHSGAEPPRTRVEPRDTGVEQRDTGGDPRGTDGTSTKAESWYWRAGGSLSLACMALAAAPDLDLLVSGLHRTVTHSFVSVLIVALAAALWRSPSGIRPSPLRIALVCGAAWASHIGVDWLSADSSTPRGMQILWPFTDGWYISGWDIFPGTERRRLLSAASLFINIRALVTELALLLPVLVALWLVRVKALTGLPPELARSHHPAE